MNIKYYIVSIKHIIEKCTKKYKLPETVAQQMVTTLSDDSKLGKNKIENSVTDNGIKYNYSCYGSFDTYFILNIETDGKNYNTEMQYEISYCGDYVGSALCSFYFGQGNPHLVYEASMSEGTNLRPCENADEKGVDCIILLKRELLFSTMLSKKDDSLPAELKQLQDEFIRDNILKNGECQCSYEDKNDISIKENGSIIPCDNLRGDVYQCEIKFEKIDDDKYDNVAILFSIDKDFKAHLLLNNNKKNNLTFNDIPQSILDVVMKKIRKAKKQGVDMSDISVDFRQVQQEEKKQPITPGAHGEDGSEHDL